jgi:hypothetical protein
MDPVSHELLEVLAAEAPAQTSGARRSARSKSDNHSGNTESGSHSSFVEHFLNKHKVKIKRIEAWQGGRRFILEQCAFNSSHNGTSAAVVELPSGAGQYCCQHDSCSTNKWPEFRELFEPGYRDAQAETEPDPPNPYTDIALSNKFVARMGDEGFRYVAEFDRWYQYQPYEGRWMQDRKLRVYTEAKRFLTRLAQQIMKAAEKEAKEKPDEADEILERARKIAAPLTSAAKVHNVVTMTCSHSRVAMVHQQFDADNWLLNCQGVAADVRTGVQRPAAPDDYFTKTTAVTPRDEPTPRFDLFMREIMGSAIKPENCKCAACQDSEDDFAEGRTSSDERNRLHPLKAVGESLRSNPRQSCGMEING